MSSRNIETEANDLRLDYSVECEECGNVMDIPRMVHPNKIQHELRMQGWRLIEDSNHCPACAKGAGKQS
jgi:hypothetical protein